MSNKSFKEIWARTEKNLKAMKSKLPTEIATAGENFFRSSFEVQGFVDGSLERWREVQRRIPGTRAYNQMKNSERRKQAILIQSDELRRSVADSARSATFDVIRWEVSSDYAIYHNQGTDKIPKREFMGKSKVFEDRVRMTIIREFGRALK